MASNSAKAEALAQQFEQLNDEVIAFVEGCDDATWHATCPDDGRPVAAVASHIVDGTRAVTEWIRLVSSGQPVTTTMDDIHASNAHNAPKGAQRSQAEVSQALRESGAAAASMVRSLDDESLRHSAPFGPAGGATLTAETVATRVLPAHPRSHLATMRHAAAQ